MSKKIITIFGSSLPVFGEEQYENAYKLGSTFAKNGFDLCTGGNGGIMEAVSRGAVEFGARAIGITLNGSFGTHNSYITEHKAHNSLFERIQALIETGDAYVALQGGTGTLLEMAAVWEFINKGFLHEKPFACHGTLWKPIIASMEDQIKKEKRKTGLLKYFETIDDCAEYIISSLKG
ncbi:MAG TPA: LOG family protein [Ignavibacteriales bacterium]|nr:LOG family protein [Ignavibacteriales bacterium]